LPFPPQHRQNLPETPILRHACAAYNAIFLKQPRQACLYDVQRIKAKTPHDLNLGNTAIRATRRNHQAFIG